MADSPSANRSELLKVWATAIYRGPAGWLWGISSDHWRQVSRDGLYGEGIYDAVRKPGTALAAQTRPPPAR